MRPFSPFAQVQRDPGAYHRLAVRLALVLFFASSLFFIKGWNTWSGMVPTAHACCNGTFYGSNSTYINNATQNTWPQASGPYCGIETAIAITNYADQVYGTGLRFNSSSSQYSVASDNNSTSAESQWGYVLKSGNVVAGKSNISLDFGTDPRSIAYMSYWYTPPGYYYHDYIYNWYMVHSTQPSYSQQVLEATTAMGMWLELNGDPLSVAINEGQHSILVTGVYSTNPPVTYFPAAITGVTYRDPQNGNHVTVDIGTWTNGFSCGYDLWKNYYGYNNSVDPEPSVGIYTPTYLYPYNWFNGFNFISRDNNSGYPSPDWEYGAYPGGVRLQHPGYP